VPPEALQRGYGGSRLEGKDMYLKIVIRMDTAVFEDPEEELSRILTKLAKRVEAGLEDYIPLMDLNGNQCGSAIVERGWDKS